MANEIDFEAIEHDDAELEAVLSNLDSDTDSDDFLGFDDDGPDPDREPEREPGSPVKKDIGPKAVASSARAICNVFDLLLSRSCAAYAGERPDRFKLTPDEAAELREALEPYIEESGVSMPPWLVVLVTAAAIGTGKAAEAYETRRAKVQAAQTEAANRVAQEIAVAEYEAAARQIEATPPPTAARTAAPAPGTGQIAAMRNAAPPPAPAAKGNTRKRFETDKNNMYHYSPKGSFLKSANKKYKMPVAIQVVRDRIVQVQTELGEEATGGVINSGILKHFEKSGIPADEIVSK